MKISEAIKKNQESYDNYAKEWQASKDINYGHRFLEKPAMYGELPGSLVGKDILCVGVGSGEELEELLNRNPKKVVAIDISQKLLKLAEKDFPSVDFYQMDMMKLDFPSNSFDMVYSSLAFHYANDWDILLGQMYRVLRKGGCLLFSTHNPDYWKDKPQTGHKHVNSRGIKTLEHTALLGKIEIIYYNLPSLKAIDEAITHAGFVIKNGFTPTVVSEGTEKLNESEQQALDVLKVKNQTTPLFYIINAEKQ